MLAVLVAAWMGLCLYAGGYGGVFPGVTMAGEDLGGLSLDHAEEQLSEALEGFLTGRVVAVAADGEDLGTYDLAELGAYAVAGEAAQAAWDVGRESGALGWLKNGWTMLRGLLGGETALEPRVYYDEDRLSAAVEEMAGAFDQEPVDASYELTRDGLFATRERDGRALDREGLAQALMSAPETVEAPWETVEAQALDLEAMADSFSSEPSQARYDKETGQVVDGEVGVTVDAEAARLVLESAAAGETVQLPADITFPEMTAQELEAVLFRDLLGTTTTTVSGTSVRRNNVRLSGEAVNGTILNDGEEFNYNQVVGGADRGAGLRRRGHLCQRRDRGHRRRRHLPDLQHRVSGGPAEQPGDRGAVQPPVLARLHHPGHGRHGELGRARVPVQEQHRLPHPHRRGLQEQPAHRQHLRHKDGRHIRGDDPGGPQHHQL